MDSENEEFEEGQPEYRTFSKKERKRLKRISLKKGRRFQGVGNLGPIIAVSVVVIVVIFVGFLVIYNFLYPNSGGFFANGS